MAMMFAASLRSVAARRRLSNGMPNETAEKLVDRYEQHYGVTSEILALTAPTLAHDARFARWFTRYQRLGMPPPARRRRCTGGSLSSTSDRFSRRYACRPSCSSAAMPCITVRRSAVTSRSRFQARSTSSCRVRTTVPFSAGDFGLLLDEEQFLTGARAVPVLNRQLATVMIADIVDSTQLAAERGDAAGRNSSGSTTTSCANSSTPTVVVKSTMRATVSSPLSTARRGQ